MNETIAINRAQLSAWATILSRTEGISEIDKERLEVVYNEMKAELDETPLSMSIFASKED